MVLKEQRLSGARTQARMFNDPGQEANSFARIRAEARATTFATGAVRKVWRHLRDGASRGASRADSLFLSHLRRTVQAMCCW
jgi:hypothetical protein